MILIIILALILFSVGILNSAQYLEKREFNSGKCTKCGNELILQKTNEYKERVYTCSVCGHIVRVSNNKVDKLWLNKHFH